MSLANKRVSIVKTVSWVPLITPVACFCVSFYNGFDWVAFTFAFVLTYPLWCFGVQSVRFCDDCVIVFRPFMFSKKIILYEQIDNMKEVTYGRTTAVLVPFDVYMYVKGKKQPMGIPMPSFSHKQE